MAETLAAIILITTSAKGANLVFRWPPNPVASPRLCRPKPDSDVFIAQIDNPWRASGFTVPTKGNNPNPTATGASSPKRDDKDYANDPEYAWERPSTQRVSFGKDDDNSIYVREYDNLFGYSGEFLASLLCPQSNKCHQKFELIVDDLAFLGHPVAANERGEWEFRPEPTKGSVRGREGKEKKAKEGEGSGKSKSPNPASALAPENGKEGVASSTTTTTAAVKPKKPSWMQKFQLAFVLDLPDPSSSASGNVLKYFDIIYEQVVFTFTAVLFQEQVLSNFVEAECDVLIPMKESFAEQGQPYKEFVNQALQASSIASAMKCVYEAIKTRSIAYVTLNNIPIELQLPPYLDTLLHNDSELDPDSIERPDDEEQQNWGPELSFGWRLPALAPWKSLLLLDGSDELEDPIASLRGPHVSVEDRALAEGLIRFLETASITLSLADMASLLDWDLESQVYPVVRWLVQHRRAKIVDIVNPGLKTIFALPSKFPASLSTLSHQFNQQFNHPAIPSLPRILAAISYSLAQQSNNHFFAAVVQRKELIPMYHDVVLWMLKRELLITLHLRIRIVVTPEIKQRVWRRRQRELVRKRDRERRRERGKGVFGRGGGRWGWEG
ncbi:hypothetical protein CC2G_007599 [Coprinopsis cinerea AmutBmut pab1-1]|nr:hypothetical protein CC2G_007599 [Coprinopsis cinerea AmutBmut pab1-1]